MGHKTGFYEDVSKGLSLTKQIVHHFNILSRNQYNERIIASLKNDGSTLIMTDTKTGKEILVDPKPRESLKKHDSGGFLLKTRDSNMDKQERIEWAKDRFVWPVIIKDNEKPTMYNIALVKDLMAKNHVNFNILTSNPTAISISLAECRPINSWYGGDDGFAMIKVPDVVQAFINIFENL